MKRALNQPIRLLSSPLSTARPRPRTPLVCIARQTGFTLIELLLAMVLVALVAISMFAAVQAAVSARDSCQRAVEPNRTADLAFEIIRRDLENAVPPNGVLAGAFTGNDQVDDRGHDADSLLFFTTAPGPKHLSGDGEVRRVEYLVQSPDGPQGEHLLIRRIAHNLLAAQAPTVFDDEVILRGISAFNIQYPDVTNGTFADVWDSTQQNNSTPQLMTIQIALDRPDVQLGPGAPPKTIGFSRDVLIPVGVAQTSTVSGL